MPEIDPVILQLRADVAKYRLDVEQTTRRVNESLNSQERSVIRLERQIAASSSQIGTSMRALATSLAAGFSAREIANMADSYTRFTNQLKVAGLEGDNLAGVQTRLFQVAQRNGVELEAVGTLYSRTAQNQKELGATTNDLIGLTRAVAASLRISGTSTNEASGALLQLGQALGSPRIQAEEFNSLLDTMQPLLREASKYIDGTGNSLSGLTRKIKDQNGPGVSNIELFRAITRAMADLERQASSTQLTISGAFTNLSNALTKYIGEADTANGASATLVSAINALATNLDTVTEAIAVLSAVMLGRFVAGMTAGAASSVAAGTALFALQARAAGAATTMEALALTSRAAGASMLAAFGGPVGAAVTVLTLGIGYLLTRTDEASTATGQYARQQEVLTAIQGRAAKAADAVAFSTGKAREEALANAKALQQETQQYIANAKAAVAAARAKASQAAQNAQTIANSAGAQSVGTGSAMIVGGNIVGQRTDREARQAQTNLRVAQENLRKAEAEEKRINGIVEGLKAPPINTAAPQTPGKPKKDKAGPKGADPAEIARRFQDDIAAAELEIKQAQAEAIGTAEARRDVEADRIEAERQSRKRQIEADKDLDGAQKQSLLALNDKVAAERRNALSAEALAEATERAREAADNSGRYEQAALDAQLRLTDSREARLEIERRILASMEREETRQLEAEIAAGRIADAQKARADLAAAQAGRRTSAERDNASPLERRRQEVRETAANMGDAIENIEIDAVDRLADGLANASKEYIKLGGIAGDVINGIIADLVKLAVKQAIFGGLGGGGGFLGIKIPGFAKGTNYAPGGLALVGEDGPEVVDLPRGSRVVPNNMLNARAAASMAGITAAGSAPRLIQPVVQQTVHVDARNSVNPAGFAQQLLAVTGQQANQAAASMGQNIMKAVPGRLATFQRDGT